MHDLTDLHNVHLYYSINGGHIFHCIFRELEHFHYYKGFCNM